MSSKFKTAVIGVGAMGLGVAGSLIRAGVDTSGYDVVADNCNKLDALGGRVAENPADAARGVNAVVVMVVNAAQAEDVLFGGNGAALTLPKGGVIIASPTMAPADAERLARRAQDLGLLYLDAPVSGGTIKAAAGQLSIMASGSNEAFERSAPVLEAIAEKVHRLGDAPGAGSAYKMINQLLAGVHIAAACEAVVFAKQLGLDLDRLYEVISSSAGNSWMFENRVPHILEGDYAPRSAVDIFVKDLGIVRGMGAVGDARLSRSAAALELFAATSAAGMGRDDDASVARMLARAARIDLPIRS